MCGQCFSTHISMVHRKKVQFEDIPSWYFQRYTLVFRTINFNPGSNGWAKNLTQCQSHSTHHNCMHKHFLGSQLTDPHIFSPIINTAMLSFLGEKSCSSFITKMKTSLNSGVDRTAPENVWYIINYGTHSWDIPKKNCFHSPDQVSMR